MNPFDAEGNILPMPKDSEVEAEARECVRESDFGRLERYIFERPWAYPGWVHYVAMCEAAQHGSPEQAEAIEKLAERGVELDNSEALVVMALYEAEEMNNRHGSQEGQKRCEQGRRRVYARMQEMGQPAP